MRGLFIKTILGIGSIIVLGILSVMLFVIEPAFDEFSQQEYKEETGFEHQQVAALLNGLPVSEWADIVTGYESYFELTVSLIPRVQLPADMQRFSAVRGEPGYFRADDEDMFYAYFATPEPDWMLLYEEGDSELTDQSRVEYAVLLLLTAPLGVIVLAMLLGIAYLLYAFNRPLRALENALSGFGHNPEVRLPVEQAKVMPNVVNAFNGMANQLQDTLNQQQVMIAAIPHELRTPIARIRFALDMLRGQSGEKLWNGLERIDSYVDDLQQATEDILLLNKLSRDELLLEPLDVRLLLQQTLQDYAEVAGLQSELGLQTVIVNGHSGLLQRLLVNLLDNAQQYSQGYIKVSLSQYDDICLLKVENSVTGLTSKEVGCLFQPFYRVDSSRSRRTGGLGIGLTLVAQVIARHKGKVDAQLSDKDILTIQVELPGWRGASLGD